MKPIRRFLPHLNVYVRGYCPQSSTDWKSAGERLGCNINDTKNLKRRYHCIPDERRSELLEFCYEPSRILAHTGNCLELVDSGTLNHFKCVGKFTSGCPDKPYYSDEIYKHPSCLHINRENLCFSAEKNCFTAKKHTPTSTGRGTAEILGIIGGRSQRGIDPKPAPGEQDILLDRNKQCEKKSEEDLSFLEDISRIAGMGIASQDISLPVFPTKNGWNHNQGINYESGSAGNIYLKTHKRQASDQYSTERIVVAIDIGSTYSGFAFSAQRHFDKDPLRINVHNWIGCKGTGTDAKTSTTVLFNEMLKVVKFGFEAESEYLQKAESNLHKNYYYFQRFKNQIPQSIKEKEEKGAMIEDVTGKQLPTILVVTSVIRFLKGEALRDIRTYWNEKVDIRWVISVPECWDHKEKFFLHKAAIEAGIEYEKLLITEETKAVNCYCKYLPMNVHVSGQPIGLAPHTRYLVLDAGGKTVELTLNEIQIDGGIKEMDHRNCSYGGEAVNKAFRALLEEIIGKSLLDNYASENGTDYTELQMNFEYRKRVAESDMAGFVNIRVPLSLDDFYTSRNKVNKKTINETISHSKYKGKLEWHRDKLRVEKELFLSLFETTCSEIIHMIRELLKEEELAMGTKTIIMVGGFSESEVLKSAIKCAFQTLKVIVPDDARLAVLKGSVLLGHQPHSYLFSRMVSKYHSI